MNQAKSKKKATRSRTHIVLDKQQYRFLLDNIEEMVLILSKTGKILFANNKALEVSGYLEREFIGSSVWNLLTKGSLKAAVYSLAQEFLGKPQQSLEVDIRTKEGRIRTLEFAPGSAPVRKYGTLVGVLINGRDITERKQAMEALEESEERYRTFIESTHEMVQSIAPDGKILFVNNSWLKALGYQESDLAALKLFDVIHPDSLEHCKARFGEVMAGKKLTRIQAKFITKDGRAIYIEGSALPRIIKGGKVTATVGFFHDVTERKQAEERLKTSEERFRAIFENAPDAMYLCDSQGFFIDGNRVAERILGRPKEEVIGKSFLKLRIISKENIPKALKLIARGVKGESTGPDILTLKVKTGKSIEVEISTHPIILKGKRVILGIARDITERKKAEEKYKLLFDTSYDAIMTLAPPSWNFTSGNRSAIEMFGVKDEKDFVSRAPWEYSPETQSDGQPSKDKAKAMILKAMEEGSNFFEWIHQRLRGEVFPATVLFTKVKIEGSEFLQATVRDITERKRMEEELLRRVEELEKINTLMVGRELKMAELKKRIRELESQLEEK